MRTLFKPPTKIPCCTTSETKLNSNSTSYKQGALSSKIIYSLMIFVIATIFPFVSIAQGNSNEVQWNGFGYSLKKVVSNTSIQSGVNFSYTILFTAPAGATTVTIQDQIPSSLIVVNVPTPAIVNGVTPVVATTGPIGSQVVTYSLTGLPSGSPASGSFTIVVKFPEGTTCNGATARNRAGISIDQKWYYTEFVSTSATAVDPWVISKSILSGPVVNPNGGNCGYLMNAGTTVTYRLSVMKANGLWGSNIGQMNMSSAQVTDVLPAGAVYVSANPPSGVTYSAGTITWVPNSGNLDAANPWAYYWVDITVTYPAGSFPNGSFVYNQATLTGNICQQQAIHQSNQTCIQVANVTPNPSGYFAKYVNVTNRVPGCQGFYTIIFCNNGNVPLSAFNINDVIPSGISVEKVQFYGAGINTPVNITANSGGNTIVNGLTSNWYDSGTIGYNVSNLQFSMTGSLPVGSCLYIYIYFNILSNPAGTQITNCATFNGLQNNLTLPQTCTTFTVAAGTPEPCLLKDICSPQTDYEPGDVIRFRLRVQNIGSANLTGASIQDILHTNFQYIGNETYYVSSSYSPPCGTGSGIPSGTTAWSGVTANHSGNNLSWNLPTINADCQAFYVGYCGYYGTYGLPYYYIEFDVVVDGSALPGVTPNNYSISGGNLTAPVTSNTVNVLVVAKFGQETQKEVSTDNGVTYTSSGTVTPGSTAKFRLKYKNTSNVPVASINLVDLLAKDDGLANDWLVLNRSVSRGSQFDITYGASPLTSILPSGLPPTPVINFAAGENICLPPYGISSGCTGTSWAAAPITENIRFNFGTYSLASGSTLREDFTVNIPSNATPQQTVCNDFAAIATANFLLNGNPQAVALTPIAAAPVCLTVNTATSCCDSVMVMPYSNAAAPGCCAKLYSHCEIKAVKVSLQNGTFSSASSNCGPIAPGYGGQSSWTFAPGSCSPVELITCVTPQQAGIVIANYTIYFANGDSCSKILDLDCSGSSDPNCCDSITVVRYPGAGGVLGCCTKIESKCDVEKIEVNVSNGTISSASWNCGNINPGYVGQSNFTFVANGCPASLVTCYDATQAGPVTITYTVTLTNGEVCTKEITIECDGPTSSHCCDSVRVEQYFDPTHVDCCLKLTSKCEIKAVNISLLNGTFTSASSSCGTLTPGYIGQTSWTFAPGNCAPVDLITCVAAQQAGIVIANYTIYFANGDTCRKIMDLTCDITDVNCCDSIKVGQVHNSDGTLTCCTRIKSLCEVDKIDVSVNNGTISSASWNCGNIAPGYAGQSNYSFNANGCAADLVLCFDAIQSGWVTVTYTITLSNGEVCEKTIRIECKASVKCCDGVKIEKYSDATGHDCCLRLDSKCEIKAVKVSLVNGTFSSASSGCGPIAPGFIGQSNWTFAPGNCAPVDLITCVTPQQTGIVIANYTIYFANGDSCKKVMDLDCVVAEPDCCDSIRVGQVVGTNGVVECCTRIESKCEVEKVVVNVTNGTISSASWNCGPIPAGYVGQSNYSFVANGCVVDLKTCFDAIQSGVVTVNYTIVLSNGDICEKEFKIECKKADPHCCDSVKVEKVLNTAGTSGCCAKLTTKCKVKAVKVDVTNGTLSSTSWNCGTLPTGWIGQSSYTFAPNGCIVEMTNCVDPKQTGIVVVTYSITFENGETCKKSIELDCAVPNDDCCALVDFKLKQKWPFKTQTGTFNITNINPASPICSVTISASPSATFAPGSLIVDGVASGQSWNSTSIPATGNLTNPAINTISFSMTGNYKGIITICVVKCDGTRCCFDLKWNKNPFTDVNISLEQLDIKDKLVAVSVNPIVKGAKGSVKFVSFGMRDESEVKNGDAEFFAISGTPLVGDDYPASLHAPMEAYMGSYNAFYVLHHPVSAGSSIGAFNLVFAGKLPKLGLALFDEEGNQIFSGDIDVIVNDTIITSSVQPTTKSGDLFEFINVYPNPSSDGIYTLTYATGQQKEIEFAVVNALGQVLQKVSMKNEFPGIHKQIIDTRGYPAGIYRMVISSGGKVLSKSATKN